jgi:hypothetical protein
VRVRVMGALVAFVMLSVSTAEWTASIGRVAAQDDVYFRERHEDPGASGNYSYKYRYPERSESRIEHLPTGGWLGSGGMRIRALANRTQQQFGVITQALDHVFTIGDSVYIRFRIRYSEAMRGSGAWGNKFIMMGETRTKPNSRVIVYMNPAHDSRGCTLGFTEGGDTPKWARPSSYGISGRSFFDERIQAFAWSLAAHVNIGWECAPPVFQTTPSNPLKGRPGANSASAVDGWYHIQVLAQSGQPGQGALKIWANNNDLAKPTSQQVGLPNGLGVTRWENGAHVGGFMDNDPPTTDIDYTLDDFEIGSAFDPSWYPPGAPKK